MNVEDCTSEVNTMGHTSIGPSVTLFTGRPSCDTYSAKQPVSEARIHTKPSILLVATSPFSLLVAMLTIPMCCDFKSNFFSREGVLCINPNSY